MSSITVVPSFATALTAGGMAGTAVDVALFPIDTIKTRLQAPAGFWKAGGFAGIYNGLAAAAAGSAPGAALFFGTYEMLKPVLAGYGLQENTPANHMTAASFGEASACLVRVPTEVVKAKMQTSSQTLSQTVKAVMAEKTGSPLSAITGGLYRGYGITLFREIPFAMIQFPLYERMKLKWAEYQDAPCNPFQAAACGSGSGGIAAAATTPLDVLKTRLMLGKDRDGRAYSGVVDVLKSTLKYDGVRALFNGLQPRVIWITIGGFVFFGAYEESKRLVAPIIG